MNLDAFRRRTLHIRLSHFLDMPVTKYLIDDLASSRFILNYILEHEFPADTTFAATIRLVQNSARGQIAAIQRN